MADKWQVAVPKQWCAECKCFVDGRPEYLRKHLSSPRHRAAIARRHNQTLRNDSKEALEQATLSAQLQAIEAAALAQHRVDLGVSEAPAAAAPPAGRQRHSAGGAGGRYGAAGIPAPVRVFEDFSAKRSRKYEPPVEQSDPAMDAYFQLYYGGGAAAVSDDQVAQEAGIVQTVDSGSGADAPAGPPGLSKSKKPPGLRKRRADFDADTGIGKWTTVQLEPEESQPEISEESQAVKVEQSDASLPLPSSSSTALPPNPVQRIAPRLGRQSRNAIRVVISGPPKSTSAQTTSQSSQESAPKSAVETSFDSKIDSANKSSSLSQENDIPASKNEPPPLEVPLPPLDAPQPAQPTEPDPDQGGIVFKKRRKKVDILS